MPIKYHKLSSVWKGINYGLQRISQDSQIVFGRQSKTKLWYQNWYYGDKHLDVMEIPVNLEFTRHFTVREFIQQGQWSINEAFRNIIPMFAEALEDMEISKEDEDELQWTSSSTGMLTTKTPYEFYREKSHTVKWMKQLWKKFIPPKMSVNLWKIVWNRAATTDNLFRRGGRIAPIRIGCIIGAVEMREHLLLHCQNALKIWNWLSDATNLNFRKFGEITEMIKWASKLSKKNLYNQLLKALVDVTCWEIWATRNLIVSQGQLTPKRD